MRTIGQFAVDLDAAIDGAGMHDQAIGLEPFTPLFRQAEQPDVFTDAGEIFLPLSLVLNAQEVYDVRGLQHFVEIVSDGHAEFLEFARHQCAWPDQSHPRPEFQEPKDVRAGHAAEKNITDDRHVQSGNRALPRLNGVKIEQRLSGVFVRSVARVDNAGAEALGEELRRSRRAMPQHDEVGMIRLQDLRGVLERLTFDEA